MQPGSNPDIQDEDEFDIDDLIDGNFSRDRSHPIRHTKDMNAANSNLLSPQITTPDKTSSAGLRDPRGSVSPIHAEKQDIKDRAFTLDLRKSSGSRDLDTLIAQHEAQKTPIDKSKSASKASFQGDKTTPHKEDRGRANKTFAPEFRSVIGTSGSLGELSHLNADLTKRMPRNGSFDAEFKKTGKETSNVLYDIILHRTEVASGAGAKTKGKILVNSYLEMENIKSDDVSNYIKMIKDGLLKAKNPHTPRSHSNVGSFVQDDSMREGSTSELNNSENSFSKEEGPDADTLGLLENYEDIEEDGNEEEEEEEERIAKRSVKEDQPGLENMEYDEDLARESGDLIFSNIFIKFDQTKPLHKKAIRSYPTKSPAASIRAFNERKEVLINSPPKSQTQEEFTPIKESGSSSLPTINIEHSHSQSEKKSEISDDQASSEAISQRAEHHGSGSFISQGGQGQDVTENPNFERSASADAGSFKRGSNNSSFKVDPFDKEELAVPEENEEIERKNTIRVLSKFDAEKTQSSSNLTLEKMIARNAKGGRERKNTSDFSHQIQHDSTHPHSQLTDALAHNHKLHRDSSKFCVPEDSLDVFDVEDQNGPETDAQVSEDECFVVTRNPLISSYKIKMTDVSMCPNLTNTFYDTATKKNYEPTIIKFATPDLVFVGTTLSTVLIYDHMENLKHTVKYNEGPKQAVTTIEVTMEDPDFSCMIVGYTGGHIAIFETKTWTLIKAITDVHTSKITSIKIYHGLNTVKFVCSDESGEVFYYQLQKLWRFYKEEHNLVVKDMDSFTFDIEAFPKEIKVINSKTLQEQEYLGGIWFLSKLDKIVYVNANMKPVNNTSNYVTEILLEKPKDVPSDLLPTLSFGKGTILDGKPTSYILVTWGRLLHLFTFSYEGAHKLAFANIAHYELKTNIQVSTWMTDDTVVALDVNNGVYFISLDEFIPGRYADKLLALEESKSDTDTTTDSTTAPTEKSYMYQFNVEKGLKLNLSFTNNKKFSYKPCKGSITSSTLHHQILMMCEDKILRLKIVSALEYLDILLRDKEWLKFLTIGLQIYHLNIKDFHSIPLHPETRKRLFLPFFQDRVSKYLYETLTTPGKNKNYYKEFTLSLLDFCLDLDDSDFLFVYCYRRFQEHGFLNLLLELFEPFIQLNRLKSVPSEQLRTIVSFYCNQGKSKLMQKLISNLDLERQDTFSLINLCLEENLYSALISICANTEENYITPFVKMINDYRIAKLKRGNEDPPQDGYRCLWYLRMCLEKRIFPNYTTKDAEKWKRMVAQMMVMIFAPENLQILYEIDAGLTTCYVMLFFEGELGMIAQENYGNLLLGNIKPGSTASDNVHFQIYNNVKQVLSTWPGPERNALYMQYFGFFLGHLAHLLRYPFLDRQICVEFADSYIDQPTLLNERLLLLWEKLRLRTEGLNPEEIEEYFTERISYDFLAEKRIGVILGLLRYSQFTLTKNQIESLIKKAQASNLIDIECFLFAMNWDYKKCFDTYLSARATLDVKLRVFGWIEETIKQFTEKMEKADLERKAIDELKEAIIDKLKVLLNMDAEKTKAVIESHLGEKIQLILSKKDIKPEFKLDILEKYLKKQGKNLSINKDLLKLHIELLCESGLKQQRRIKEILQGSNEYPLNMCLDICKKYMIKSAWAYLEFKQGNISASINISHEELIDTLKKGYIERIEDEKEYVQTALKDLLEYLNQNTLSAESTWFKIMINVFKVFEDNLNRIKSEEEKQEFKKLEYNVIDQMLENIFASFDSKDLMNIVEENYDRLQPNLRRIVLAKLIFHHIHEEFILSYCKKLLCLDILEFIDLQLLPSTIKGQFNLPNCEACNKPFKSYDFILWFNCGHLYHSTQNCCPAGQCAHCQVDPSTIIVNTVYNKLNRGAKGLHHAKSAPKQTIEDDISEGGRSRASTRSFKDTENQYFNEKMNKLSKYYGNKNQRQFEINDFTEKYL